MRLDAPPVYSSGIMGLANYMLKRHGEAVRWLRECALPNLRWTHLNGVRLCAVGTA
jgi:hypothetical protein